MQAAQSPLQKIAESPNQKFESIVRQHSTNLEDCPDIFYANAGAVEAEFDRQSAS